MIYLQNFDQIFSESINDPINPEVAFDNAVIFENRKKSSRRAYRLTYKDGQQKTRIVYVPRYRLLKMRKMIANYVRVLKIIEHPVDTNIEIFKQEDRR